MRMAQQNHDDRCNWQSQEHTSEAKQLAAGKYRKDNCHWVKADTITHQQRRQQHTFEQLSHCEDCYDADQRIEFETAVLEESGNQCGTEADDDSGPDDESGSDDDSDEPDDD